MRIQPEDVISILALTLDRFDSYRAANGEAAARGVLAQVARAVRRLAATVGVVAAAYRNGMIIAGRAASSVPMRPPSLPKPCTRTVQRLRLPNSEFGRFRLTSPPALPPITGSGKSRHRPHPIAHPGDFQGAASRDGRRQSRVVAVMADAAPPKLAAPISENIMLNQETGAVA